MVLVELELKVSLSGLIPVTYFSCINVNEIISWIVSDSAFFELKCYLSYFLKTYFRYSDIRSLSVHMETFPYCLFVIFSEEGICTGCSIP